MRFNNNNTIPTTAADGVLREGGAKGLEGKTEPCEIADTYVPYAERAVSVPSGWPIFYDR